MIPKTKIKVIADVAMTALLLVLMAGHITGKSRHEWLGLTQCLLFIAHNALNWKWYRTLPQGGYTAARSLRTAVNFLLLAAMLGIMVSGIMISNDLFGFLNIKTTRFARGLHMASTSWGFVLISLHLGLHWAMVIGAAQKRMNKDGKMLPTVILRLLAAANSAYGAYAFVARGIWQRMFLLVEYAFFDYEEPAIFFFADYIATMGAFASAAYYALKLTRTKEAADSRLSNPQTAELDKPLSER